MKLNLTTADQSTMWINSYNPNTDTHTDVDTVIDLPVKVPL